MEAPPAAAASVLRCIFATTLWYFSSGVGRERSCFLCSAREVVGCLTLRGHHRTDIKVHVSTTDDDEGDFNRTSYLRINISKWNLHKSVKLHAT